jgi:myo-inositol-1(or 4)-monophosphatase
MLGTHRSDMTNSAADLRFLAEQLARTAGAMALAGRRSLPVGQPPAHDTKSSQTDPVTEFDRAAEEYIVGELRRLRPDDAIVGEEGANDSGTSGIEWHIDPIDGTANFLYDLPAWCTSVAAVDVEGSLAGAVYVPVTDEMFSASRKGGATRNGLQIKASAATDIAVSMVGTGFSYLPYRRLPQARRISKLLPQVRDIRRYGSAAIDLAYVACGRLDAYFEEHLNSWDMAAGLLIATEAGAITSDLDGGTADEHGALAAAPGIHQSLLDAIRGASS